MLYPPEIERTLPFKKAFIWLTLPREAIARATMPAMKELLAVLKEQGVGPAGPWMVHHLEVRGDVFDVEICLPIANEVIPTGRVLVGEEPAMTVVRTTYQGPHEGLPLAWSWFEAWIRAMKYAPRPDLWEVYLVGPESTSDPNKFMTQLYRPME